jgi:hypothetical protein
LPPEPSLSLSGRRTKEVEIESIREQLARAAGRGCSKSHKAYGGAVLALVGGEERTAGNLEGELEGGSHGC